MRRNHATKDFSRFTVIKHRLQFLTCFGVIFCQIAGKQHLHAQRHGDFMQTRVNVFTGQELHRFANFNRITCAGGQHLVHVSQQRCGFHACAVRHADNRFGE
ncbi:hypothetical protein D3C75_1052570 [compost metagenome]